MRKLLIASLFIILSLTVALPTVTYADTTPNPTADISYNTGVGHPSCAGVTFENPSTPVAVVQAPRVKTRSTSTTISKFFFIGCTPFLDLRLTSVI